MVATTKSNRIAGTFVKESSNILRNSNGLQLVWMRVLQLISHALQMVCYDSKILEWINE